MVWRIVWCRKSKRHLIKWRQLQQMSWNKRVFTVKYVVNGATNLHFSLLECCVRGFCIVLEICTPKVHRMLKSFGLVVTYTLNINNTVKKFFLKSTSRETTKERSQTKGQKDKRTKQTLPWWTSHKLDYQEHH